MTEALVEYNTQSFQGNVIQKLETATLADLRTVELEWLRQGAKVFQDIVMIAVTLGEPHTFWSRANDIARVFNSPGMTLLYTNIQGKYSPEDKAAIHKETILVTLGDWHFCERTKSGEPIIRETIVCALSRYGVNGHWSPVEVTDKLASFRPGKWLTTLLTNLPYAFEIHNSRHEMDEEFQRKALSKKLLIGEDV
jgi:hypothetical protein